MSIRYSSERVEKADLAPHFRKRQMIPVFQVEDGFLKFVVYTLVGEGRVGLTAIKAASLVRRALRVTFFPIHGV